MTPFVNQTTLHRVTWKPLLLILLIFLHSLWDAWIFDVYSGACFHMRLIWPVAHSRHNIYKWENSVQDLSPSACQVSRLCNKCQEKLEGSLVNRTARGAGVWAWCQQPSICVNAPYPEITLCFIFMPNRLMLSTSVMSDGWMKKALLVSIYVCLGALTFATLLILRWLMISLWSDILPYNCFHCILLSLLEASLVIIVHSTPKF